MSGLVRFTEFLLVAAFAATLAQVFLVTLREPAARRGYALSLGQPEGSPAVEARVSAWRRAFSRKLWLNLVGIPLLIIGVLIVVGEYGS